MNDQIIWDKVVKGDASALKSLHDKYYYQLWLFAMNYITDKSIAQKMISNCFIELWNLRKNIVIEMSLESLLLTMLNNQIIDRKLSSKSTFIFTSDVASMSNEGCCAELYKAVQRIPGIRRQIIELAVFESFAYSKIARKLSISIDTVKTQMGHAYQFLKEEFDCCVL